jgi:flagellar hook-basal body complex protein FliE
MSVAPITGIPAITPPASTTAPAKTTGAGFGETISKALQAVSDAEASADMVAQDLASGGDSSVQDLMVAMSKASLSVDLLVQVRNRAVEAYQEIMRMQI